MQLHFLGTTGYHPNRRRDTACFMIPEHGVILDAGTGIFRARDLIQTPTLQIFLTHTHLDHVVGLTYLLDVLYQKSLKSVTVYVDPTKRAAIENHLFDEQIFPVRPVFEFADLGTESIALPGQGKLTPFPLHHPGGCLGFRLDWPQTSLAYVTDTTADLKADYVKKIKGVNTLIHECYLADGCEEHAKLTGHSCLTPVAQVARACGAKKTYLVHLSPLEENDSFLDLKSVSSICSTMEIPEDGQVVNI
jgi:ribonuclease BN (tRNA processing enzyme)